MKKIYIFVLSLMFILSSTLLFAGCGENEQNNGFVPVASIIIAEDVKFNLAAPILFKSSYSIELENETEVTKEEFDNSKRMNYPSRIIESNGNNIKSYRYKVGDKCKYSNGPSSDQKFYFATIKSVEEKLVKFKALDGTKIEIIDKDGTYYLYSVLYYKVVYFI